MHIFVFIIIFEKSLILKDGFPLIFRYFSLSETHTAYWLFFNIKEVLSFPLILPAINNSRDKWPNDKN